MTWFLLERLGKVALICDTNTQEFEKEPVPIFLRAEGKVLHSTG